MNTLNLSKAVPTATPVRKRKRLGVAVAILLFVFSSIPSFGSDTEFVNWQHLDDTLHGIDYNITTNFYHYFRLNEAGTLPDGSSFLQQDFRGSVNLPLVARYFSNQAIISVLSGGFNGLKQYVVDVANGIHRDPLKLNVTDSISYTVQSNNASRVISRLDSGIAVTNHLTVTDHDLAATITNRVERLVNVISKGVAVTNVVDVRSSTLANAISNQTDRVVDSLSTLAETIAGKDIGSGSFSFNTNYVKDLYPFPTATSSYPLYQLYTDVASAKSRRTFQLHPFPKLSGDYLTDSIALLRYLAYNQITLAQDDIKKISILDSVTNSLLYVNENITGFKNQNHLDLTSIQTQDSIEYAAMEEFRQKVIELLGGNKSPEEQEAEDEAKRELSDVSPPSDVEGFGDTSFSSGLDIASRTSIDLSSLKVDSLPNTIVFNWGTFEMDGKAYLSANDNSSINLNSYTHIFSYIRSFMRCVWWGLSLFLVWCLFRFCHYIHKLIMDWTAQGANIGS